jgi:uncharacterized membrane protein (DUF485 family)
MLNKLKQINGRVSPLWKQLNSLLDANPLIIDIFLVIYFWVPTFILIVLYSFSENFDFIRCFAAIGIIGSLAMFMMCTYWIINVIRYVVRNKKASTSNSDIESKAA